MNLEKYTKYAKDVVEGRIVTGEFIKLTCQRYLSWFDKDDRYFDPEKADKPVKFISHLKHTTGKFNKQPFILQDWQEFLVYHIFGWYWKDSNTRVIRNAYIEIARKCGKTSLLAALSLYCLMCDGEAGAEVDIVAPSRDQSNICFTSAKNYGESINKGSLLKPLRNVILFNKTKSKIKTMSSDSKFGDGFNTSLGIIDEYAAFDTNEIADLITSSMGMRTQPLMVYITTANFNLYAPAKEYRDMCVEILRGLKEDDSIFPLIYEMDEKDDWTDENNWKKAVPSLDITVTKSYLKDQVTKAKNNPSLETAIKTKNLNIWCQSKVTWLSNDLILKHSQKLNIDDFAGDYCYCGIDLSAVSDLTCISFMIAKEGKYYFKTYPFLPEQTTFDSPNRDLYRKWKINGNLSVTPGNVCDYDFILEKMLEINKICPIQKISYDSWNATQFAINATNAGLPMVPFNQSLGAFNRPTTEFERLLKQGRVIIDDNPITRWCIQNAELKYDHNENRKPIKGAGSNAKIDCIIAMLEALGGYLEDNNGTINEIFV